MELNEKLVRDFIGNNFPNVEIVKVVSKFIDGGIKIKVKTATPFNKKERVSDLVPAQEENWFVFYQNPEILVYWRDGNNVDRNITSRFNDYMDNNPEQELAD